MKSQVNIYENFDRRRKLVFESLSRFDWDQIEMAANGCISGYGREWPFLMKSLKKLTGLELSDQPYQDLIVVCRAKLIEAKEYAIPNMWKKSI